MRQQLIRYEAARKALAAATRVDEVKDIRDKAVAMMAYAAQAKDTELIGYATEIRYRAEQKGGVLLIEMRANGERQKAGDASGGNGSRPQPLLPKLEDLGVTKTQSSRWQALARLDADKFEEKLMRAKAAAENSTTSAPRYARAEFTGEIEWYTPAEYVDLARRVLGASTSTWRRQMQVLHFHDYSASLRSDCPKNRHYSDWRARAVSFAFDDLPRLAGHRRLSEGLERREIHFGDIELRVVPPAGLSPRGEGGPGLGMLPTACHPGDRVPGNVSIACRPLGRLRRTPRQIPRSSWTVSLYVDELVPVVLPLIVCDAGVRQTMRPALLFERRAR
jgi:hypothetical protein